MRRMRLPAFLGVALIAALAAAPGLAQTCDDFGDAPVCVRLAAGEQFIANKGEFCKQNDNFTETHVSDNKRECLRETLGNVARLENKWLFPHVPAGTQCLRFEGFEQAEDPLEFFNFWHCDCLDALSCNRCNEPVDPLFLGIPDTNLEAGEVSRITPIGLTSGVEGEVQILLKDGGPPSDFLFDQAQIDHLEVITYITGGEGNAAADHQTGPGTILAGDYTLTLQSDDNREILRETPDGINSHLKHVWRFDNIPSGSFHELLVEGRRGDNPDGDNFRFGWNTTGGLLFSIIPDAVIDSFTEPPGGVRYPLAGGALSGTIYIMIEDTIGAGNDLATVEIDRLAILTSPDCTFCGDGVKDADEECDGDDLGQASCSDAGCANGSVTCNADCTLNLSACTTCCDLDDVCEPGEDCFSCPRDCHSAANPGFQCGNGVCEAGDGEDCVICPADCNGVQKGKPGNRFCCGDGDGDTPVGCGDARCTSSGFACTDVPNPSNNFCCGDGVVQPDEGDGTICNGNY